MCTMCVFISTGQFTCKPVLWIQKHCKKKPVFVKNTLQRSEIHFFTYPKLV